MTKRQNLTKAKLLKQLEKIPIVEVACQRTGIGRATYYRWKNDDEAFRGKAEEAIEQGCLLINDMAESKLINGVKDGNHNSIVFWLRHNHPKYHSPSLQALDYRRKPKRFKDFKVSLVEFIGKKPNDNKA